MISIQNVGPDVHENHDETNTSKLDTQCGAQDAGNDKHVPESGMDGIIPGSVGDIKSRISFLTLLKSDGHALTPSGDYHKCLCPFHREKTPSFNVYPNETYGRCFGCDWKGDIFDYVMKRDKVQFPEALDTLKNILQGGSLGQPRVPKKKLVDRSDSLTKEQKESMAEAVGRLLNSEWLLSRVADPRGWNLNTIRLLAQQGYLGWHRAALAFVYPTGLKVRGWPGRRFEWEFGYPHLWRGDRIKGAKHIFLTEGETDTISLIDMGLEQSNECAVVCVPGTTSFQAEWAPILTGKKVTLCFDSDEAGQKATEKVALFLAPHAAELMCFNPGEVTPCL